MIDRRVAIGLALICCCGAAESKEIFPRPLQVEVAFVSEGPEGLRDELERELLYLLERADCFPGVELFSTPPPQGTEALLLRLAIERVTDETDFDLSIAQRYAEDALPDAQRQLTSWLEVDYRLELRLLPESIPLRAKSSSIRVGYRPRLDEDPREENRIQAVDQIVRAAKSFACKGSAKKLRKTIDRARAASAESADAR